MSQRNIYPPQTNKSLPYDVTPAPSPEENDDVVFFLGFRRLLLLLLLLSLHVSGQGTELNWRIAALRG